MSVTDFEFYLKIKLLVTSAFISRSIITRQDKPVHCFHMQKSIYYFLHNENISC